MKYPDNERILIVRPCLKYICLGNKPAAKLLSLLLYYARNCSEKEATFSFTTTQEELIADLIDEMDVKTLHRTAVPLLRLLGFLEVDGSSYRYKYTLHLDLIGHLLSHYKDNKQEVGRILLIAIKEQLDKLPIEQRLSYPIVFDRMQLEKCLIEIDKCLIELDKLPIEIDKCLIPFRQMSNSKRGRKARMEVRLEASSENADSKRESRTITDKERAVTDARALEYENNNHSYRHDHTRKEDAWNCENWRVAHGGLEIASCIDYQAWIERGGRETPTEPRVEAVKIGVTDGLTSTRDPILPVHGTGIPDRSHSPTNLRTQEQVAIASTPGSAGTPLAAQTRQSLSSPTDGATTVAESSESRASGVTQESILNDWDAVQGQPQSRDARLLKAARDGVRASPTREELAGCRDWLPTTDRPGKPWYRLHGVALWDVIEKLGAYRSYLALSIEPAPLADMKQPKPIDVYTAYSLDTERSDRNLEKLRAKRLAREAAQQGGAL